MRHGEGFDAELAAYRSNARQTYVGLPESAGGGGRRAAGVYPFRSFGTKTHDYSNDKVFAAKALAFAGNDADREALMARLSSTMHLNHYIRDEDEKARAATAEQSGKTAPDTIPAGYTYLAQLAIHDMTFSRPAGNASAPMGNLATPALDLSTLYGEGRAANQLLFEHHEPKMARSRFRTGFTNDSATGGLGPQEDIPRIPLGPSTGHAKPQSAFEPLLADVRNADNLILSQLTLLFMKFHNKVFDSLAAQGAFAGKAPDAFDSARRIVTATYRNILRGDLLKRLLPDDIWQRYFAEGAAPLPTRQPVTREAVFAALRFGHSMVRSEYDFGPQQQNAGLGTLLDFFGLPADNGDQQGLPLDSSWIIDWRRFFDFGGAAAANRAHGLGPAMNPVFMSHPTLRHLSQESPKGHSLGLAFRTLMKGIMQDLPTGQAAAERMRQLFPSTPILGKSDVLQLLRPSRIHGAISKNLLLTEQDLEFLAEDTPLFVYILIEARHFGNGARLGPVGGDFAAYTFACGFANSSADTPPEAEVAAAGFRHSLPQTMPQLISHIQSTDVAVG